ncbi:MAG: YggT family protein [Coriobacteriia bacterium]|nr:YggT family protein [Coriobacteriia bacterium]
MEVVVSRVIMFVFGTIEVLIAIRFVLMLLGANAQAGFTKLIYGVSGVFMAPFSTIFSTQEAGGAVFEWSALVAIAVYALVAWGLVALIRAVSPREHSETVERVVEEQDATSAR